MNQIKRYIGIFLSLSLFLMISCYNDEKGLKIPPIPGEAISGDTASDTGASGTDGGVPVPVKKLNTEDVKNIINSTLQNINVDDLLKAILAKCNADTINLVNKDGISVDAQVSCNPLTVLLTITLNQYHVNGIECALNGIMTIRAQFPKNALGTYLLTINTQDASPLTTQGGDCGGATIALTGLSTVVTIEPFSAQYSGVVAIDGEAFNLNEFSTPDDIMAILKDAIDKIPWDELLAWFNTSTQLSGLQSTGFSGLAASTQSSSMLNVYDKDGLKADVGISLDFSNPGVIIDLTFTGYKIDSSSAIAITGSVNMFATLESVTELKLVLNTKADAPLSISGIPLISPKIGLADVTIYYDWSTEQIVNKSGDNGTITYNKLTFDFDPSWITKIMDLVN